MEPGMPPTLGDAIATEPMWLQAWLMLLGLVHLLALAFVVKREGGSWGWRPEPVAIFASFLAAGVFMSWLYQQVGYVRLLGIAHIVFWTPAYVWVALRFRMHGTATLFGKYLVAYFAIAGLSLVIDVIDVIRHLLGDGELLHRHG